MYVQHIYMYISHPLVDTYTYICVCRRERGREERKEREEGREGGRGREIKREREGGKDAHIRTCLRATVQSTASKVPGCEAVFG